MQHDEPPTGLGRRAFLRQGSLVLTAAAVESTALDRLMAGESAAERAVRFALLTDLHYADKKPAGSRFYRETLTKLAEAIEQFDRQQPQMLVELGDLVDAADSVEVELGYVRRINREVTSICAERHYVLGNHCVYTLKKDEFLGAVEQEKSYYSFDKGGFHFVVLDSCFRSDGVPYGRKNFQWTDTNIPAGEIEWLKADLAATPHKAVVLAHQRLDVSDVYGVKNGPLVRKVLEESDKVLAVFQGHSHENDYHEIAGIHYCTLAAMIEGSGPENNGYSVVDIARDGTIRLQGFRRQQSYGWGA